MSFIKKMEDWPLLPNLIKLTQKVSLPGFQGVPIYNVVTFIYKELLKDDIIMRANSIAFSIFLSLFPTLIFFFTIVPLVYSTTNLIEVIDSSLISFMPIDAHTYLMQIIKHILSIKREGLLSFGFILALFFASSGVKTLMMGFDKSYNYRRTFKRRSFLKYQITSVALTLVLAAMLLVAVVLIVLGKQVLSSTFDYFTLGEFTSQIFRILRWIVVAVFFYFTITIIYRYGPSMYKRTKVFNIGAYLATLLIIVISLLFSYFVNRFGQYNELYGSIGALIVVMLWLQFNAVILLIGFELNTSIAVNKNLIVEDVEKQ